MMRKQKQFIVAVGAVAAAAAVVAVTYPIAAKPMAHGGGGDAALIRSATAAAPASVSGGATVIAIDGAGHVRTLRRGRNGWTCMPDSPTTPGPDPMCMDRNAMKWAEAWMGHTAPPADTVGLMYMLAGGTDASNTDPYAERPTRGNAWVRTGPHLMVVGSASLLEGYPSGPTPNTAKPYVMWAGTPYAHLMIPIR